MLALVNWGTFDSASGGTFQSDTDSTIHSDGVGTRSAERSQTNLTATVVNGLPVSLTSYANFVVNELFSVTVVNEMQVLLTTHESTNFSNLLFLLIQIHHGGQRIHTFS